MDYEYTTTSGRAVVLLPITLVRPHENHDEGRAIELRFKIGADGYFTHPVCLDRNTMTILDGHHRVRAARLLEFEYVPSVLVDYSTEDIAVAAWRLGELITRQDVLAAASSGALMPIKTSRHLFGRPIGECSVPLGVLCKSRPSSSWPRPGTHVKLDISADSQTAAQADNRASSSNFAANAALDKATV
jgi:L-serine kinase (ADP)